MSAEKLSVSMDTSLVKLIRGAASREGVSLSTWLADAAAAKARNHALREALDADAKEHGPLTREAARQLVAEARQRSITSRPKKRK